MYEIGIFDYIMAGLWLVILGMGGFLYASLKSSRSPAYRFYNYALWAKMLGGLGFALTYSYYYNYQGDTFAYFADIRYLSMMFIEEPYSILQILTQPSGTFNSETYHITSKLNFYRGEDTFIVIRVITLLNLLGGNTYLGTTIIVSFISFHGVWKMFLLFREYYAKIETELAFSILFFPSVVFWGSGILKDSIVISGVGFMLYYLNELIVKGRLSIFKSFFLIFVIYVTATAKSYVVISLLPATALWLIPRVQQNIENKAIKVFISPIIFVVGLGISVYLFTLFEKSFERFSLDEVVATAKSYQDWHYYGGDFERSGRGSSYTLGEYDATLPGIISMIPSGISVTLFRPYLWEVRNTVMGISAIESSFVILLTLYALWKVRITRMFYQFRTDSFLAMCLIFSLIFAFAVGFSSYNFGALVRYKIPCIPMYLSVLFVLLNYDKLSSKKRTA